MTFRKLVIAKYVRIMGGKERKKKALDMKHMIYSCLELLSRILFTLTNIS